MPSDDVKRNFRTFAVFFGIIFGMTAILVVFTLVSRTSWETGLAYDVQSVLNEYSDGEYTVGKYLHLQSAFSTSSAVYSLLKKDGNGQGRYYGVMVRIPSIVGPVPAVFVYSEKDGVQFAGYAVDMGKVGAASAISVSSGIMAYWERLIPEIVSKAN